MPEHTWIPAGVQEMELSLQRRLRAGECASAHATQVYERCAMLIVHMCIGLQPQELKEVGQPEHPNEVTRGPLRKLDAYPGA